MELQDWTGVTALEYGRSGKLVKVTDPKERITAYGYDALGRLLNVQDGQRTESYTLNNYSIKNFVDTNKRHCYNQAKA